MEAGEVGPVGFDEILAVLAGYLVIGYVFNIVPKSSWVRLSQLALIKLWKPWLPILFWLRYSSLSLGMLALLRN